MDADNLLITNRALTEEEYKKLRIQAAPYNEKLDALTKHISELEAQLESAKNEKKALLESFYPIQKPLAPFRRLPQDVVREIFVACLDPKINPTMSKKEAPTLLTRISSSLRQIALTTPELWAAIHIPILGSVPCESSKIAQFVMDRRADGVKEWLLRRSGSLPLRISIRRGSEAARFGPFQFTPPTRIKK